ncbi:hypothetical protein IWQ57_003301 [Coemansia nantahalensis]|uniref:Uncharacterized protein n=1 Tax=Coemansia nantahalensis TaxID=2789366 RepID=A0ACC1JXA7_9FUNG|nr:hypothetical protein IWQ57_003301 [Coemansia nantahalensis]
MEDVVQGMIIDSEFDTCPTSYNEWQHLGRVLGLNPEWRGEGERSLESVALITNPNPDSDKPALPRESNIPEILGKGRGGWIRYLVFHATEPQRPIPEAILYWRLTEAVCAFTGHRHRARFPANTPSLISESMAELVEVVLRVLPNVRGILIACAEMPPILMPPTVARHISYCAMTQRAPSTCEPGCVLCACSPEMQPFVVPTKDYFLPQAEIEPPLALPLALSSFDFLRYRPLPLTVVRLLEQATEGADTVCVHEVPAEPSPHVRRHIFFSPALPFVDSFGVCRPYDWCQVVVSENRVTGLGGDVWPGSQLPVL